MLTTQQYKAFPVTTLPNGGRVLIVTIIETPRGSFRGMRWHRFVRVLFLTLLLAAALAPAITWAQAGNEWAVRSGTLLAGHVGQPLVVGQHNVCGRSVPE
jgi:hypothetical protein